MAYTLQDFSTYTVDASPPVTLGGELSDGLYDQRYIDVATLAFYTNSNTRTTSETAVSEGNTYQFYAPGGNRCRIMWVDLLGDPVSASDEGSSEGPHYGIAPVGAVGVYYYYTNENLGTPSIKQVTGGFAPCWVKTGVNYFIRSSGADQALRTENTGTTNARRGLVWADVSGGDIDIRCNTLTTHKHIYTSGNTLHCGPFLRGSGGTEGESCYAALLRASQDTSTFEIGKYVAGAFTTLATISYAWSVDTEYFIRFQATGTTLEAKIWTGTAEDEPVAWTLSTTDTSLTTGAVGLFQFYSEDATHYYEYTFISEGSAVSGSAQITTTASVTTQAQKVAHGAATASATASLTAEGYNNAVEGDAQLTSVSSITATTSKTAHGAATMSCQTGLTVQTLKTASGAADLASQSSATTTTYKAGLGAPALSAISSTTATGTKTAQAQPDLTTTGIVTATSSSRTGAAQIEDNGVITTTAKKIAYGAATCSAAVATTTASFKSAVGSASLAAETSLTVTPVAARLSPPLGLTAQSFLSDSDGVKIARGPPSLSAAGTTAATGSRTGAGYAELSGTGAIEVSGFNAEVIEVWEADSEVTRNYIAVSKICRVYENYSTATRSYDTVSSIDRSIDAVSGLTRTWDGTSRLRRI